MKKNPRFDIERLIACLRLQGSESDVVVHENENGTFSVAISIDGNYSARKDAIAARSFWCNINQSVGV